MNDHGKIGAVLVAAGASVRLGRPKQLVVYEGKTLLARTYEAIRDGLEGPIFVVTGYEAARIGDALVSYRGSNQLTVVCCPEWEEGMGKSIAFGASRLLESHPDVGAIVISVCDQPHLTSGVISKLVKEQKQDSTRIVASSYRGATGPPVCFGENYFSSLCSLKGDRGAKDLIQKQRENLTEIPFDLGSIEIDTSIDYENLLKGKNTIQ